MKYRSLPTQEKIKNCFDYKNGFLFWKNPSKYKPELKGVRAGHLGVHGYRVVSIDGVLYPEHRIIFKLFNNYDPNEIDHVNGIKDDNRIKNLVNSDRFQNCKNTKKRHDNKSGHAGVFYREDNKKWRSFIYSNKKRIDLGQFDKKEEAIKARIEAEKIYNFSFRHGK